MHCVVTDDTDTVPGCPFCNRGNHLWEDCSYRSGSLDDDVDMMVVQRQNKPPLKAYKLCWFNIWEQYDRPPLAGLPWTRPFSRDVKAGQNMPTGFENFEAECFEYQFMALPEVMAKSLTARPGNTFARALRSSDSKTSGWIGGSGWAGLVHRRGSVSRRRSAR
jgi:hypothetical protein